MYTLDMYKNKWVSMIKPSVKELQPRLKVDPVLKIDP